MRQAVGVVGAPKRLYPHGERAKRAASVRQWTGLLSCGRGNESTTEGEGSRIMTQGLLLFLVFGQFADSKDFPKAVQERALAATVSIVNRTRQAEGSGVIIGRKDKSTYILTASHLLSRGDHLEVSTFAVDSYPEPAKIYEKAEVVAFTKDTRDLALIRLTADDPPRGGLVLCPTQSLPKEKAFDALSVGCAFGGAPLCILEKVKDAKQIRRDEKMRPALFWETSSEQSSGRSGGPLLDRRGRVIGVASGVNDGKGYYSHADEIHSWLKSTDFDFLIAEKEPHKREP